MKGLLAAVAVAVCLAVAAPATAFADDWRDCADAYKFSPMLSVQGCLVDIQNVPDLNPNEKSGPLGFRYKKGSSKWCRIRVECPRFVCDGPYQSERGQYGSRCISGTYTVVMERAAASIKLKDASWAHWCPPGRPGRDWYIGSECR